MIVATAGHVDHGKTSLVRALTGQDTDRTEEERRRGLSIELGFAWLSDEDGGSAAVDIVDVPGHERFMRTLMAGIGAVDAVMLVVAADEGVMPQTLEHIELLRLLRMNEVIVVLSKVFRTPVQVRDALGNELRKRLSEAGIESVQLAEVDSLTGLGIDHLRQMLRSLARRSRTGRIDLLPRFWIDRHFHRPGSAHVVTGTLHQGTLGAGQMLTLAPGGERVRVRALQRHGAPVKRLVAGERGALDLSGTLSEKTCPRGAQLLHESAWLQTTRLDARMVRLTGNSPRGDLQLHLAGGSVTARAVPLRGLERADRQVYWQWILAEPLACRHGDQFIVRNATTRQLVGSGVIIDPLAPARGRQSEERLGILEALDNEDLQEVIPQLLERSRGGIDLALLRRARHVSDELFEHVLAPLAERGELYRRGNWSCHAAHLRACSDQAITCVKQMHADAPQSRGPTFAALARRSGLHLPSQLLSHTIRELLDQGELVQTGPCLHRPDHRPVPSPTGAAMLDRLRPLFEACAPRPPVIGELMQSLQVERNTLQAALDELSMLGLLVLVGRNRYLLPESADQLYRSARQLASQSIDQGFTAAEFRDLTQIGRNHSIAVLEHFDRSGLTRLRLGRRWLAGPAAP